MIAMVLSIMVRGNRTQATVHVLLSSCILAKHLVPVWPPLQQFWAES